MARVWHALAVSLPRPQVAEAVVALTKLGATGLQEDTPAGVALRFRQPWDKGRAPRPPSVVLLRAWFDERPADEAIFAAIGTAKPEWTVEAEQDWNEGWKQHFRPIVISPRLTIAAPWHGVEGAVLIEPGNAFGTGDHITTRSCLVHIDRLGKSGGSLLDVGCGSGILALAGAKIGMSAWGVDIDPDAVKSAQTAAQLNNMDVRFDNSALDAIQGPFDLVVANLYAEVIAALAPQLRRLAKGHLIFAGILSDRAHLVDAAMAPNVCEYRHVHGDWASLVFKA